MAGKQWMKTRPGHIALAALAWTLLGVVFALPDLSAPAGRRYALLMSLTLWWSWGIVTPFILWRTGRSPSQISNSSDEFWRISFRAS